MNLFIASSPRSGSSMLTNLLSKSKFNLFKFPGSKLLTGSIFNKSGYFEDIKLILLNDMIINSIYGYKYNFLFPPNTIKNKISEKFDYYKSYKSNLFIPKNFLDNLKFYTNHNWDNWGISRMIKNGKWENCYSKFGVNNFNLIIKSINIFNNTIAKFENNIFKDSRMVFTLHKFKIPNLRVVVLRRRNKSEHIQSLRNHYGPNMFKKKFIKNTRFVSNHFNLKINYLNYQEFINRYEFFFKFICKKNFFIEVFYEDLLNKDKKVICNLEKFVNNELDLSIIK